MNLIMKLYMLVPVLLNASYYVYERKKRRSKKLFFLAYTLFWTVILFINAFDNNWDSINVGIFVKILTILRLLNSAILLSEFYDDGFTSSNLRIMLYCILLLIFFSIDIYVDGKMNMYILSYSGFLFAIAGLMMEYWISKKSLLDEEDSFMIIFIIIKEMISFIMVILLSVWMFFPYL